MTTVTSPSGPEPSVETLEMVCDRLADLGLTIGPDVARDLVCAILAAEAPRLDARLREALGTSLETIRIAAQSAVGVLAAAAPVEPPKAVSSPVAPPAKPAARPSLAPTVQTPAAPPAPPAPAPATPPAPPVESRRPIARRGPGQQQDDFPRDPDIGDEPRPVFKRPRGR